MGMRSAIDAMCKWCIYDPHHTGTWREQVFECKTGSCPLHPYRPLPQGIKRAAASGRGQIRATDDKGGET